MGFFSSLSSLLGLGKKEVSIIVVGLDNSGKTTILNQLKPPESKSANIAPTVGYNIANFSAGNLNFCAFDMAGQSKFRNMWESYYSSCQALVFVLDSCDQIRMPVARDELWTILDHKDIQNRPVPILVLGNKMDIPGGMSAEELTVSMGLEVIRNHKWKIQSVCALSGQNLDVAMQWLSKEIAAFMERR